MQRAFDARRVLIRVAVLIACVAVDRAAAQSSTQDDGLHTWTFKDLPYYEPLKSDPRAARMTLIVPAWSKEFPHSVTPGTRFVWQITLGRELPIVGGRTQTDDGRAGAGEWGLGLWIPVSFHMIEDHKDESAPIVDTDYRFGMMAKFQYGLSDESWLGVRFVPWAHESTHLGDEYTILAQKTFDTFARVNPSFEYYEYGVSYERMFGGNMLTLRHGGIQLHGDDGYYSDRLIGETEPTLTPSEQNFEPSFGVELRGWPMGNRDWFVSLDLRHKLAYNFNRLPGEEETKHWSYSVAVGRAIPEQSNNRIPLRDYFFYWYKGVNPFGQLREQSDFWFVGIGWTWGI